MSEFYWPVLFRLEKENAIYSHMLGKYTDDTIKRSLGFEFENSVVLPNHDKVIDIIESKAHHIGNDEKLLTETRKYVRHIAVYKSLRAINNPLDPYNLDGEVGWPDNFHPILRDRTLKLQKNMMIY